MIDVWQSAAATGSRTATGGPSRASATVASPFVTRCRVCATTLPAEYVGAHVTLGYASTVHTAQGLTADVMHGIVTGEESRQMLYTMMSRGRSANHVHVVVAGAAEPHELMLPGLVEQMTATEMLDGILAHDGAAVSASTTASRAASPQRRAT